MIDWTRMITADQATATRLADWRATRTLSRLQFCTALRAAGILTDPDALAAASGQIPEAFKPALAALAPPDQTNARLAWAAASTIDRTNPFITAIAATAGLSDQTLDDLFGWDG
ncbi:MAG: hypothetical protein Q7J57_05470 [Gemmobacter sp.]|nr:hypothetical protein [Gemmobacter sp.]